MTKINLENPSDPGVPSSSEVSHIVLIICCSHFFNSAIVNVYDDPDQGCSWPAVVPCPEERGKFPPIGVGIGASTVPFPHPSR